MIKLQPAYQVIRERFDRQPDGTLKRTIQQAKIHWLPMPSDHPRYTPPTTDKGT